MGWDGIVDNRVGESRTGKGRVGQAKFGLCCAALYTTLYCMYCAVPCCALQGHEAKGMKRSREGWSGAVQCGLV